MTLGLWSLWLGNGTHPIPGIAGRDNEIVRWGNRDECDVSTVTEVNVWSS